MNEFARRLTEAFQAGCRRRIARCPLPAKEELHVKWGLSVLEAQSFEGGYNLTCLTYDMIQGGAAEAAANRQIMQDLDHHIALSRARERIVRLMTARASALDPDGKIKAAREAGHCQFLEVGKQLTGDQVMRLGYSLDEVKAFVAGFEELRVMCLRAGGARGSA